MKLPALAPFTMHAPMTLFFPSLCIPSLLIFGQLITLGFPVSSHHVPLYTRVFWLKCFVTTFASCKSFHKNPQTNCFHTLYRMLPNVLVIRPFFLPTKSLLCKYRFILPGIVICTLQCIETIQESFFDSLFSLSLHMSVR